MPIDVRLPQVPGLQTPVLLGAYRHIAPMNVEKSDGEAGCEECEKEAKVSNFLNFKGSSSESLSRCLMSYSTPLATIVIAAVCFVIFLLRAVQEGSFPFDKGGAILAVCIIAVELASVAGRHFSVRCHHRLLLWSDVHQGVCFVELALLLAFAARSHQQWRAVCANEDGRTHREYCLHAVDGMVTFLQCAPIIGCWMLALSVAAYQVVTLAIFIGIEFGVSDSPSIGQAELVRLGFHVLVACCVGLVRRCEFHIYKTQVSGLSAALWSLRSLIDFQEQVDENAPQLLPEDLLLRTMSEGLPLIETFDDGCFVACAPEFTSWSYWCRTNGDVQSLELMREVTRRCCRLVFGESSKGRRSSLTGILSSPADRPLWKVPPRLHFVGDIIWVIITPAAKTDRRSTTDCMHDGVQFAVALRDATQSLSYATETNKVSFCFAIGGGTMRVALAGNNCVSPILLDARLAERLLTLCPPDEIIMTDPVRSHLPPQIVTSPLGNIDDESGNPIPLGIHLFTRFHQSVGGRLGAGSNTTPSGRRRMRTSISFVDDSSGAVSPTHSQSDASLPPKISSDNPLSTSARQRLCTVLMESEMMGDSSKSVINQRRRPSSPSPTSSISSENIRDSGNSILNLSFPEEETAEVLSEMARTGGTGPTERPGTGLMTLHCGVFLRFRAVVEELFRTYSVAHLAPSRFPAHTALFFLLMALTAFDIASFIAEDPVKLSVPWFVVLLVGCVIVLLQLIIVAVRCRMPTKVNAVLLYLAVGVFILGYGASAPIFSCESSSVFRILVGHVVFFATNGQLPLWAHLLLDTVFVSVPTIIKHALWSAIGRGTCTSLRCDSWVDFVLLCILCLLYPVFMVVAEHTTRHQFINSLSNTRMTREMAYLRNAYQRLLKKLLPTNYIAPVLEGCRCCDVSFCPSFFSGSETTVVAINCPFLPRITRIEDNFGTLSHKYLHLVHRQLEWWAEQYKLWKQMVVGDVLVFIEAGSVLSPHQGAGSSGSKSAKRVHWGKAPTLGGHGGILLWTTLVTFLEEKLQAALPGTATSSNDEAMPSPLCITGGAATGTLAYGFSGTQPQQRVQCSGPALVDAISLARGYASSSSPLTTSAAACGSTFFLQERSLQACFPRGQWLTSDRLVVPLRVSHSPNTAHEQRELIVKVSVFDGTWSAPPRFHVRHREQQRDEQPREETSRRSSTGSGSLEYSYSGGEASAFSFHEPSSPDPQPTTLRLAALQIDPTVDPSSLAHLAESSPKESDMSSTSSEGNTKRRASPTVQKV